MVTRLESAATMSYEGSSSDFEDGGFPAGLPFESRPEWDEQYQLYAQWWYMYSGKSLREKRKDKHTDDTQYVFPLQINYFRARALLHAMLTFGMVSTSSIVRLWAESLLPDASDDELENTRVGNLITAAWKENKWLRILPEAARIFQALGGFYVKVVHDLTKYNGVRIEIISPHSVYPTFAGDGSITELYVAYPLENGAGREYGFTDDDVDVFYVEHWTREEWTIQVGRRGEMKTIDKGPNMYRLPKALENYIPFAYCPRMKTNSEYGLSLLDDVINLVGEINERAADVSDMIYRSKGRRLFASDWNGTTNADGTIPISDDPDEIIDMGRTPPGTQKTEITSVDPPDFSPTYIDYLKWMEEHMNDSTMTASVALGKDEGSQRSAATLGARFAPTAAVLTDYRLTFSEMFNETGQMILTCMKMAKANKVEESDFAYRVNVEYWHMLPQDNLVLAQRESILRQAGIRSREQAIQNLGDVRNIQAEIARIDEEAAAEQERAMAQLELRSRNQKADDKESSDDGTK